MDENGNETGVNLQCITGSKIWKESAKAGKRKQEEMKD